MKLAALLAKGACCPGTGISDPDCTNVPAIAALRMATINGAKALGLDAKIGSIVPGKEADVIAVDLGTVESMPIYSVTSHLVYATTRNQVTDVWVQGKLLLRDRQLTTIDITSSSAKMKEWAKKVLSIPPPES